MCHPDDFGSNNHREVASHFMAHVIENIKFAQAPKWDGKENDLDKRDRETSELTKSSIISKEQLEIDQGKMKKVKSEKVCPNFVIIRKFFGHLNFSIVRIFRLSEFFGYSEFSILRIFRLSELFDFRIFVEPLNSLNFVSCNRFFQKPGHFRPFFGNPFQKEQSKQFRKSQ